MGNSQIATPVWETALAGLIHSIDEFSQRVQAGENWKSGFHIPSDAFDPAIQLAAELAAGTPTTPDSPPDALLSIFSLLNADEQQAGQQTYQPQRSLSLEDIFSQEDVPNAVQERWTALVESARVRLADIDPVEDPATYLEALLGVLQQETWCIPSRYDKAASLYNHSRMTAALAVCLNQVGETQIRALQSDWKQQRDTQNAPIALLVGGDISGVQDFIYTISNKGATSALRGRSFYLQLLTEGIARFVLRKLGLPITSLIYAGGGNFYILARPGDEEKLPQLRTEISRLLYRDHQGDLYVAIDGVPLALQDFISPTASRSSHPLSERWGDLARTLTTAKSHRFSELEKDELQAIFAPQGHGGNEETRCQVCGHEIPAQSNEEQRKCEACLSYEELGRDLRQARYIAWKYLEDQGSPIAHIDQLLKDNKPALYTRPWKDLFADLGFAVEIISKEKTPPPDYPLVQALTDPAFSQYIPAPGQAVVRHFLVNVTPLLDQTFVDDDGQLHKAGGIKPFEKLAEDAQGIQRLGVLRMDVDNLGKLFAGGLGDQATLARIASLSFTIRLFFEGWVGKLAAMRNKQYGDTLYAIYSGGDDLFFVGAWDQVAEFAREIARDLERYARHPGVHVSGGMVLIPHKYPLAKAATDALQQEEAAKSTIWWDADGKKHRKSTFSFLGVPLPWHRFGLGNCSQPPGPESFETAHALMHLLVGIVSNDSGRKSVLRALLYNYDAYQKMEKARRDAGTDYNRSSKPQALYGPWNWRMFYLLRRKMRGSHDEQMKELADELNARPEAIEWLGLAARWAEFRTRK